MRNLVLLASAATLLLSCSEPEKSIHVTETRPLTLHDRHYPGNLKDQPPVGWRRLPGTQFRLINYLAGPNEEVEIVMGETQGQILENANRWLGQFGLTPLQTEEYLGKTEMLGRPAFIVEGSGTYSPGMGQAPKEGYSLIGVIRQSSSNIITLKMTGPTAAVEAQREAFFEYMRSFFPIEDHFIETPGPKESSADQPESSDE
jgi:hypothetical protein